jgi:CBS domain-containing protein
MLVRDVMRKQVLTAHEETLVSEAAVHMVVSRLSGFPITDDADRLIGLVTELDVIRAILQGKDLKETTVGEIMTRELITVEPDDTLDLVMQILESERIIRVPVVADGGLIRIVSRGDAIHHVVDSIA